jgi:endonuclease YncB( thermonuclease family)
MTPLAPALVAIVLGATDGDTVRVRVPDWSGTPFGTISVRVFGINSPESSKALAKCDRELELGKEAKSYAKQLLPANSRITFVYRGPDKYGGRVLGTITLPDGRDFGTVMIGAGLAVRYDGKKKGSFCK